MTQDKREKIGTKRNIRSAKSKKCSQRARKKFTAILLNLLDSDDELSTVQWHSVPSNVQAWLAGSFTRKKEACKKQPEEKATVRTVLHAVQAGVWVERKFRVTTSPVGLAYPAKVITSFQDIDKWSFNVFALSDASEGHSLKFMMCELFTKYDFLSRFKIPLTSLISFAEALEVGYRKYQNPYHNSTHAADVTQTVHALLLHTGIMHWFTDLEILAMILSSFIHDYEHTGTNNHFHVQTSSETALLYNDNSVLENHHVSSAYRLMQNEERNILVNLTKEEWRELRHMVIDIVLATDMARHFHQVNTLNYILHCMQQIERLDKGRIMCMMVHVADISHPAKSWELHHQWSEALMQEFFGQGDKELGLGLPISPLCDRNTTNVPETQIGFIDVILQPAFAILFEAMEKIVAPIVRDAAKSGCVSSFGNSRHDAPGASKEKDEAKPKGNQLTMESGTCVERNNLISLDVPRFRKHLMQNIQENRKKWKESQDGTRKESPGKETGDKPKDKVSKGKEKEEKPQKPTKCKHYSSRSKKYCTTPQTTTVCDCQLCSNGSLEPINSVNYIVYDGNSSEQVLSQENSDIMEVTESYEELVDSPSSWRKAVSKTVESNIQEMRGMVPKMKPLRPNESDDVIIEEVIPDDSKPQSVADFIPSTAAQEGTQQPPNVALTTTELTQSDMEIFSLWNEVTRRAAKQQKEQQYQSHIPADIALQMAVSTNCQGPERTSSGSSSPPTFVLQVISFDSPSVTCATVTGPNCEPFKQEATDTPTAMNIDTPANAPQQNETNPSATAAVSVTSLSYGVFKIPQ